MEYSSGGMTYISMKRVIALPLLCLVIAVMILGCSNTGELPLSGTEMPVGEPSSVEKTPVLVELFTSEGCSSCPPADRLLIDITTNQPYKDAEVITLGYHVDYWDHIGWKDQFSSREYTKRQEAYARQFRLDSTYTPQIVIDGGDQVVGNNRQAVDGAIARARGGKGVIRLELKDDKLSINIDELPEQNGSTVFLAVAESGLRSAVSGGENSGRNLEHASVVRELRELGAIEAGRKSFSIQVSLQMKSNWKQDRLRYVVFVQNDATLKIHGIAATGR